MTKPSLADRGRMIGRLACIFVDFFVVWLGKKGVRPEPTDARMSRRKRGGTGGGRGAVAGAASGSGGEG